MKYTVVNFGTLRVKATEMVIGMEEEALRSHYRIDDTGHMRIGMNGLVVETGGRVILIDPGCAGFLPGKMLEEYGLEMDAPAPEAVRRAGYPPETVTDVLFTHLHFDHGSGAFERKPGGIFPAFPNADYIFSRQHYDYTMHPDPREKGSFFSKLMRFSERKVFLEDWKLDGIDFLDSSGHTPHMKIPVIKSDEGCVVFITDLAPMRIFMDRQAYSFYDMDYAGIVSERKELFDSLERGTTVLFYHEPHENCRVTL